jgi:hypothetical protein
MFNPLMMAVEANGVIAQRMMKFMLGGRRARREAKLMVAGNRSWFIRAEYAVKAVAGYAAECGHPSP